MHGRPQRWPVAPACAVTVLPIKHPGSTKRPANWHVSHTEPCLHKLLSVLPLVLLLLQLLLPALLPGGYGRLHCFRKRPMGLLRLCLQPPTLLLQCTGGD